jgi:hypothetical protein
MLTIPYDSPWIVISIGAALAVAVIYAGYRWWAPAQAGWQRFALAGVRAFICTLVAVMLLPLMCSQTVTTAPAPRLAILVDTSPTMHRGANGNTTWDAALARAFDDELWRNVLPGWQIEHWAFGDHPQVLTNSDRNLIMEGRDLQRTLQILADRPHPPDAVVVMTQNGDWQGADFTPQSKFGFPVSFWQVPQSTTPHAVITDIIAPPITYAGELTEIKVELDLLGAIQVRVTLREKETGTLWGEASGGNGQPAVIRAVPPQAGFVALEAEVDPIPGEVQPAAGKKAHITVQVVDEPITAQIITFSPTREGAMLTRSWRGDHRLRLSWGGIGLGGQLWDGSVLSPADEPALVVWENPDERSQPFRKRMQSLLDEGAGLVILCSAHNPGVSGVPADWLPGTATSADNGAWLPQLPPAPTITGLLGLTNGQPWLGVHSVNPAAGTEVVLWGWNGYRREPLAALVRHGKGKILWILGMDYSSSSIQSPDTVDATWRSISRQLASPWLGNGPRAIINQVIRVNQPVAFSLHLNEPNAIPNAVFSSAAGQQKIALNNNAGIWEGSFTPSEQGAGSLSITGAATSLSIPLYVDEPLNLSPPSSGSLQALAALLGGSFIPGDGQPSPNFITAPTPQRESSPSYLQLNDWFGIYLALIVLLCGEWYLRRRIGLV